MRRVAVAAALLALGAAAARAGAAARCDVDPGPAAGLYRTMAPFEHFAPSRTQVFPHACAVRPGAAIAARRSAVDFRTPYIAATRDRDELYVYGYGSDAAADGGYVAKVDPVTLTERWRTRIPDPSPAGQWSYPGVLAVHGNGFLYAVYGSALVKLDPATGATLARRELPEDPEQTGAAYNGMVVLRDGRIVTKKIERGPCAAPDTLGGLICSARNALPSLLVVVDPERLEILSTLETPEPVTGRITAHGDHVYVAGRDDLRRFRYRAGRLSLDPSWGPVRYRFGAQQPGTGPGVLGRFLVVQTNFLPSREPLTLTAVSLDDDERVFRARPFRGSGDLSVIVSKAALDAPNRTVVTHDTGVERMAALRLHPRRGFTLRWKRRLRSLSFSALVGEKRRRQIVIPDQRADGERVVWLDLRTGATRAQSEVLARQPAPGNIVTPGFGGRFHHVTSEGVLWELRAGAP
jgi:hypothetical protein